MASPKNTITVSVSLSKELDLATVNISGRSTPITSGVLGVDRDIGGQICAIYLDSRIHRSDIDSYEGWEMSGAKTTILKGVVGAANPDCEPADSGNGDNWLAGTSSIKSKGALTSKATSLGDLARRRSEHEGQFFTPKWVSSRIWEVLTPSVDKVSRPGTFINVVDTSVGSGRLFAPAPVKSCIFWGLDTDSSCIDALSSATKEADTAHNFQAGALENLELKNFGIAVINPPFGLTLSSPNMFPFDSNSYGKFGPLTSALSHKYALNQALDGASVVAALLPMSMDEACLSHPRLKMAVYLPADTFMQEGANVRTAVYFFDSCNTANDPIKVSVSINDEWPSLQLTPVNTGQRRPVFRLDGISEGEQVICTPVTGDNTVRIDHHARRIIVNFNCGFTEAKVLNAILESDVKPGIRHRYPKEIKYKGDGRLYLDTYLLQDDPQKAFESFLDVIANAGGAPKLSPTFEGYWEKLKRCNTRLSIPFRHVVKTGTVTSLKLVAKRSMMLDPKDFNSPAIRMGEEVLAEPLGGEYKLQYGDFTVVLNRDEAQRRYSFPRGDQAEHSGSQWVVAQEGVAKAFPSLAHQAKKLIAAAGINWLWPYQEDSLIEHLIRNRPANSPCIKPANCAAVAHQCLRRDVSAVSPSRLSGKPAGLAH